MGTWTIKLEAACSQWEFPELTPLGNRFSVNQTSTDNIIANFLVCFRATWIKTSFSRRSYFSKSSFGAVCSLFLLPFTFQPLISTCTCCFWRQCEEIFAHLFIIKRSHRCFFLHLSFYFRFLFLLLWRCRSKQWIFRRKMLFFKCLKCTHAWGHCKLSSM